MCTHPNVTGNSSNESTDENIRTIEYRTPMQFQQQKCHTIPRTRERELSIQILMSWNADWGQPLSDAPDGGEAIKLIGV